jgi:hypothetical protein
MNDQIAPKYAGRQNLSNPVLNSGKDVVTFYSENRTELKLSKAQKNWVPRSF